MLDLALHQIGDKVRLRSGPNKGERGVLHGEEGTLVKVELGSGQIVLTKPDEITNFSLAARKAWEKMPKRSGRPRSANQNKKMVSFRLDMDVWRMLGLAAEFDLIVSREQAINSWLRKELEVLLQKYPEYQQSISNLSDRQ